MPHLRDYFCAAEEALQTSFKRIEQNVPLWYHLNICLLFLQVLQL